MSFVPQWPSGKVRYYSSKKYLKSGDSAEIKNKIEDFFEKLFGYKVLLFPSERNALHRLILASKLTRKNNSYVPPFSALCMYEAIGRTTNVSTIFQEQDFVIVNHKWGFTHKTQAKEPKSLVIEDSCDSIILDPSLLFPNKAKYQLISLPKVMGVISGGIIIFKDANDPIYEALTQINGDEILAKSQFKLKNKYYKNGLKKFSHWEHYEFAGSGLAQHELNYIFQNLKKMEMNYEVITERKKFLKDAFGECSFGVNNSGPIAMFSINQGAVIPKAVLDSGIQRYNYDLTLANGEKALYRPVLILPTHFGISDSTFNEMFNTLIDQVKYIKNLVLLY